MLTTCARAQRAGPAAALLIALSVACPPPAPRNPVRLDRVTPALPPGPFQHEQLSWALAAGTDPADRGEAGRRFRSYLATIAVVGPRSRPDLFPGAEDVLAYLVNARLAWAVEFEADPRLAGVGAGTRRRIPIPLDGERSSLARLEREILRRAPHDPRLGLWFTTGAPGQPPRPPAPLEAHAFGFLLDLQARRCGAEPGTWVLEGAGRRLVLAEYLAGLPGLSGDAARRARRLLDAVPPPTALRQRILDVCGNGLQHCRIDTVAGPPPA